MKRLNENAVLDHRRTSRTRSPPTIDVPDGGADGVIIAQGGAYGGWSAVHQGRRAQVLLQRARHRDATPSPPTRRCRPATQEVRAHFAYDGGGLGKGGTVTLFAGDDQDRRGSRRAHAPVHVLDGRDRRRRQRRRLAGVGRVRRRRTTSSPARSSGCASTSATTTTATTSPTSTSMARRDDAPVATLAPAPRPTLGAVRGLSLASQPADRAHGARTARRRAGRGRARRTCRARCGRARRCGCPRTSPSTPPGRRRRSGPARRRPGRPARRRSPTSPGWAHPARSANADRPAQRSPSNTTPWRHTTSAAAATSVPTGSAAAPPPPSRSTASSSPFGVIARRPASGATHVAPPGASAITAAASTTTRVPCPTRSTTSSSNRRIRSPPTRPGPTRTASALASSSPSCSTARRGRRAPSGRSGRPITIASGTATATCRATGAPTASWSRPAPMRNAATPARIGRAGGGRTAAHHQHRAPIVLAVDVGRQRPAAQRPASSSIGTAISGAPRALRAPT